MLQLKKMIRYPPYSYNYVNENQSDRKNMFQHVPLFSSKKKTGKPPYPFITVLNTLTFLVSWRFEVEQNSQINIDVPSELRCNDLTYIFASDFDQY